MSAAVNRDLREFCKGYLAVDGESGLFRDGRFTVKTGRTHSSARKKLEPVQWSVSRAGEDPQPRSLDDAVHELARKVSRALESAEEQGHHVWVEAHYHGSTRADDWRKIEGDFEIIAEIPQSAASNSSGAAEWALAQVALRLADTHQRANELTYQAALELGEVKGRLAMTELILDASQAERSDANWVAALEHLKEPMAVARPIILSQLMARPAPAGAAAAGQDEAVGPEEPAERLTWVLGLLEYGLGELIQLNAAHPEAVTDEHRAQLASLLGTIDQMRAAQQAAAAEAAGTT